MQLMTPLKFIVVWEEGAALLKKWAFYYDIAQYGRIYFMVTAKTETECVLFT